MGTYADMKAKVENDRRDSDYHNLAHAEIEVREQIAELNALLDEIKELSEMDRIPLDRLQKVFKKAHGR